MHPDFRGRLFSRIFYDFKTQKYNEIQHEIEHEDKNYLLNVDEQEYVNHLVDKYKLQEVSIDLDSMGVYKEHEKEIPIDDFFGDATAKHMEYEIQFSFTGDPILLTLQPQSSRVMHQEFEIYPGNKARFILKDWNNNPAQLKTDLNQVKNNLDLNVKDLNSDINNSFNNGLEAHIEQVFNRRKNELQKYSQTLTDLGIPVIKKDDIPQTYAIPSETIKTKVQITDNPKVTGDKPVLPDPTLSKEIYQDILQTIHDVGKVVERLPSIYSGKDENSLRDLLLLYLEPRYTNAGGETFNSAGKTDILIRYKNSNVFIAELKFWEGKKQFTQATEQLFGYLTWRDSKAALIVFCKNKDLTSVLEEIKSSIREHTSFVEEKEILDETWLNYLLSFPGDANKHIELAIQVFHLK